MSQQSNDLSVNPVDETIRLGPLEVRFLVTGENSDGTVAVFELVVPAGQRLMAPAHSHDHYEETFYGIEGVLTWTVDGKLIDVGPGQALCIPRSAVHRFDNNGTEDVKGLCVITPAAIGPQYFREVAEVVRAAVGGPPDRAKMMEIMRRHGLTPVSSSASGVGLACQSRPDLGQGTPISCARVVSFSCSTCSVAGEYEMDNLVLSINGKNLHVSASAEENLLTVLRDRLGMTGTKYGCGEGQCGACTVLLDGKATRSCITPVSAAVGAKITTIEGLEQNGALSPVQQAFLDEGAFQCGYCTSGMVLSATALLRETHNPTDEQIVQHMDGNICRCGTYPRIVQAIKRASQLQAKGASR